MSAPTTVIIPTYNGVKLLEKHLPAVEAVLRDGDQLIIADDASSDESVEWLRRRYTLKPRTLPIDIPDAVIYSNTFTNRSGQNSISLLRHNKNVRFAKNINIAVTLVTTSTFVLVNNDVSPAENILDILSSFFYESSVFAVGCHEIEHAADKVHGGKNSIWFERGIFQHSRAKTFTTGETAWVSGGSGMFATDKWRTLGGFDERFYPAYWEDTDLSFRAHQHGWKTLFAADAIVYHHHETTNAATFGNNEIARLSWQHQKYFTRKHANAWQLALYYVWQPYWWWKMKQ